MGVLKKPASGVLARLSCSRIHMYAPRAKRAAAFPSRGLRTGLDGLFEPSPMIFACHTHNLAMIQPSEKSDYSIVQ